MTPRPTPSRRPSTRLVAVGALLGALALTGCGATDSLVGLHPAPTEQTAAAPLDTEGATAVAARLLAAADAPVEGDAKAAKAARAEVLTGDALRFADARAARAATTPATTELATAPEPTVVAQSQGKQWPRAILASTLDQTTSTQWLHVMVSEKPDQPFRITASVPMFGGAELPALGEQLAGAPLVDPTAKSARSPAPADVLKAYAAAIAQPKGRATDVVSTDDTFATGLRSAAATQAKALGKLATLSQTHQPMLDDAISFRLADGGSVTFAMMRRDDRITLNPKAKELVLPAEYAKLVGARKVTKSLALHSLEPVVLVVPATGEARVIGASDLLVSGKGR